MKEPETSARFTPKVFAIVIVAAVVILAVGTVLRETTPAASAPVTPEPSVLRTIPGTDVNPFGANFYLHNEVEPWKVEKTLQMAKEAGIGWVKQQFPWEDIESSKGKYLDAHQRSTWHKFDQIVTLAEKYDLQLIVRLDRPPAWTRKDNSLRQAPPDNFQDYADFVYTVVSRYKGRIHYYQLWNEPNIYPEWGNQAVDPAAYVRLLKAGYDAAKRADPNVYILSAPLAQTLEKSPRNLSDIDYLEKMYDYGAKDYFDILMANAYGFDLPPDDPPNPDVLNFSRFVLLRQIMEDNGDAAKPIWFNEFGWNASPSDMPKDKLTWGRVTEEQQAEYTRNAIETARRTYPWAGVFCIWYFRQDGHIRPESSEYYFRMVDPGFTPRQIYHAIQQAPKGLVATRGSYQETNPAIEYRGSWHPMIEPKASGSGLMIGRAIEDNATITFRGQSLSLVVEKGPNAGLLYLTLDGKEANQVPTDRQGRSYIDLYAENPEWQVEVPIAENLAAGEHKLRLVIGRSPRGDSNVECALDGFIVAGEAQSAELPLSVPTGAIIIVLAGLGLGLIVRRRARRRRAATRS